MLQNKQNVISASGFVHTDKNKTKHKKSGIINGLFKPETISWTIPIAIVWTIVILWYKNGFCAQFCNCGCDSYSPHRITIVHVIALTIVNRTCKWTLTSLTISHIADSYRKALNCIRFRFISVNPLLQAVIEITCDLPSVFSCSTLYRITSRFLQINDRNYK